MSKKDVGSSPLVSVDRLTRRLYTRRTMGYVVRALPGKKRSWKVQYATYIGGKQKIRDIPESEFSRLGFHTAMALHEAQARRDQINAQGSLLRQEERRIEISKRLDKEEKVLDAFLDKRDVQEFEQTILFASEERMNIAKRNKMDSHWRKARRILVQLKIKPEDWNYHKRRFYDVFARERLSPSYTQKIISVMNIWGRFHCRKYRLYFEPLEFPVGHEKERIADKYYDKDKKGRVSDPITPEMLRAKERELSPEWFNWFYLSVWFGLRPAEVDTLNKPPGERTWHVGTNGKVAYLAIYQPKLTAVPRDKRTKIIPCITPEQMEGLAIIKKGQFKRPSHVRHIRSYFGEHVTLYGGRKGFPQLMRSLGQTIEDYTAWMGHQTMERTFKDYKDKQAINYTPVVKKRIVQTDRVVLTEDE